MIVQESSSYLIEGDVKLAANPGHELISLHYTHRGVSLALALDERNAEKTVAHLVEALRQFRSDNGWGGAA